mmetsp:Transcript_130222/g.417978  ORF Transcript_130222/g.417978 Transcript_130222/m.417978 type:complete len:90 (+) Transcript_130222:4093-4362(+)
MNDHTVLADACSQPGIVILRRQHRQHLTRNASALSACSMGRESTTCTLCFLLLLRACLLTCLPSPSSLCIPFGVQCAVTDLHRARWHLA